MAEAHASHNLDVDRYLGQFRGMYRIRAFEMAALRAVNEKLVLGAVHPSVGQEAVCVGVCENLRRDDLLLSTHRGHGHTMAKGASAAAMMRELLGRQGGTNHGKGGSMHIADFDVGMLGANGVVAANISIAAGAAHAIALKGDDRIFSCFFGDGAINRGPFLEGLNWAKVYGLPVLFVCEDNRYSATTKTSAMTSGTGAAERARSLGMPAREIDGNDIVGVDQTAREMVSEIRADRQPQLLVASTYRLLGHAGADRGLNYRSGDEVDAQWAHEPISRCAVLLKAAGVKDDVLASIQQEAEAEMQAALDEAKKAPWPAPEIAYDDVQDVGAEMWSERRG